MTASSSSNDAIATSDDGVTVAVKVVANASRNEVIGSHGDRVRVRVCAPPERGKANEAVCVLLRDATGATTASVIAGASHRHKTVLLTGVDADGVRHALTH